MFRLIDNELYEKIDITQPLTKGFMSRVIIFYLDEEVISHIKTIVPWYDNLQARYPTLDLVFDRFGEKNIKKIFEFVMKYITWDYILKTDD